MEPTHDDVTMDNWTADVTDTNATRDDNDDTITTTTTTTTTTATTVDELASSHDNQGERDVTHCFTCRRRRRRCRLRVITDQSCCLRFHSHHTLSHLHFSSGFTAPISNGGRRDRRTDTSRASSPSVRNCQCVQVNVT